MRSAITWHRGAMLSSRSSSKQSSRPKASTMPSSATTFALTPSRPLIGDVRFANGEFAQSRVLQVQFRNVKTNDLAQFKDISTQVVVAPTEYEFGQVDIPYEKALASNP